MAVFVFDEMSPVFFARCFSEGSFESGDDWEVVEGGLAGEGHLVWKGEAGVWHPYGHVLIDGVGCEAVAIVE